MGRSVKDTDLTNIINLEDKDFEDPLATVDGLGWLGGDIRGKALLCLAAGGGRQSVLYAAAGAKDGIGFMRQDGEFNALLANASHNEYAIRTVRMMNGLSRRFWYMHFQRAADLPLCARLHATLARAISTGDPEAATLASDKLVDYVEVFTRATIEVTS